MLMRQPEYLDDKYGSIKKKIDSDYTANNSIWQTFWTEATLDTRLEAGDTSLMADLNQIPIANNRNSYYFNRVRPLCNMVSGYQRRNRKSTIVVPLENGDQKTADQWTKILLNIYKREGIYETISEAFHQGACISGLNMLHVYMDYTSDPVNGDIKVDNLAYNSFFVDPYFRKTDLSDCSFIWRRSYLSHSACAALLPDHYDEIMALPGNPTGTGRDGRFQFMPESYGQSQQNRLAYDEYYYKDWRDQLLAVDKSTGEVMEVPESVDIDIFLMHYPSVTVIKQKVPTVRLAIMVQDKVFYDGPQPLAIDTYPFVPIIGYYNPMMPYFYSRIQGICRSLRDPQILYNRRIILNADLLESQVNSGFIFKENAVIDVKHLFQTGQGRIIPIKREAQITDVQPLQPPQIPPSYFQMQESFAGEFPAVSGINEELMGASKDDTLSGIMSAMRQAAGIITLQPLFDRLDHAQILLGELIMRIIRSNYGPGKIKNLLEGDEPEPLFYNKAFGKYHCMVELGFNTESQKQMQLAQMIQLKQVGVMVPDEDMLEAATLQNKTKIIETIAKNQQQQAQLQQQQAQAAIAELQSRTELAQANIFEKKGLGAERFSRIEENKELAKERKAAAVKDEYLAVLHLAQALKELDMADITQLEKLIAIQQMIKAENNPQPSRDGPELERGQSLQRESGL